MPLAITQREAYLLLHYKQSFFVALLEIYVVRIKEEVFNGEYSMT